MKAHRRQLARYAMESDAAVAVQGALLKLSPELFIKLYQGRKRERKTACTPGTGRERRRRRWGWRCAVSATGGAY
ncbi:MAG: hypothetical protein ACLTV6_14460 [Christensenellales bacterium]